MQVFYQIVQDRSCEIGLRAEGDCDRAHLVAELEQGHLNLKARLARVEALLEHLSTAKGERR